MCVGVLLMRTCPHFFIFAPPHLLWHFMLPIWHKVWVEDLLAGICSCLHHSLYPPSIHPLWQLLAALQYFLEFGVLHSVHCSFVFLCHCTNIQFCATAQICLLCEHTNGHCASHASVSRSAFRKCFCAFRFHCIWRTSKTPTMIRCENLC